MINTAEISEKIHSLLVGQGLEVNTYSATGELVPDPVHATRFVVKSSPRLVVRFDPSKDTINLMVTKDIYGTTLYRQIKHIANDNLLNLNYSIQDKIIAAKDEGLDARREREKEKEEEDLMNESNKSYKVGDKVSIKSARNGRRVSSVITNANDAPNEYVVKDPDDSSVEIKILSSEIEGIAESGFARAAGTSKTSYHRLDDSIKIIVKHRTSVNEEQQGARSRNISSIYIQRGAERFKMAENSLPAARAMARHLHCGGEVWDSVGESISKSSTDLRQLREFVRYVQRKGLINESNEEYVTLVNEQINNISNTFVQLAKKNGYAVASESIIKLATNEAAEAIDEDLESAFVETHFDEKVDSALSNVKSLVAKRRAFESVISAAIQKENFANLKNLLQEDDMIEFTDPAQQLGHQVHQLSNAAENPLLQAHLSTISSKITSGTKLSVYESNTVKTCLQRIKTSISESRNEMKSYANGVKVGKASVNATVEGLFGNKDTKNKKDLERKTKTGKDDHIDSIIASLAKSPARK